MNSPDTFYEKTQKAKNSLKNLIKSSKGNIKSLIQKTPNEPSPNPIRNIISLSQIYANLNQYGPAVNFYLEAESSRESSPSLMHTIEQSANKIPPLLKKDVINLLFENFQTEVSDDFQRFNQLFSGFDHEKIGLIITNIPIKTEIEILRSLIMSTSYKPDLSFLKMMFFKSKPAVVIKIKKISDFFMVFNFLNSNKTVKQVLGADMKMLWFRNSSNTDKTTFAKIILRNIPSNFNTAMIRNFVAENTNNIEVKFIEDPMYYKGQLATIIVVETLFQAENLAKKLNKFPIKDGYILKAHLYAKFTTAVSKSHFKEYLSQEKKNFKNDELLKLLTEKFNSRKRKAENSVSKIKEEVNSTEKNSLINDLILTNTNNNLNESSNKSPLSANPLPLAINLPILNFNPLNASNIHSNISNTNFSSNNGNNSSNAPQISNYTPLVNFSNNSINNNNILTQQNSNNNRFFPSNSCSISQGSSLLSALQQVPPSSEILRNKNLNNSNNSNNNLRNITNFSNNSNNIQNVNNNQSPINTQNITNNSSFINISNNIVQNSLPNLQNFGSNLKNIPNTNSNPPTIMNKVIDINQIIPSINKNITNFNNNIPNISNNPSNFNNSLLTNINNNIPTINTNFSNIANIFPNMNSDFGNIKNVGVMNNLHCSNSNNIQTIQNLNNTSISSSNISNFSANQLIGNLQNYGNLINFFEMQQTNAFSNMPNQIMLNEILNEKNNNPELTIKILDNFSGNLIADSINNGLLNRFNELKEEKQNDCIQKTENIPLPKESPPKLPSNNNSPLNLLDKIDIYEKIIDDFSEKKVSSSASLKEKQRKRKAFLEKLKKEKNTQESDLLDDL